MTDMTDLRHMMTIKDTLERIEGMRFVYDRIDVLSGPGRVARESMTWIARRDLLEEELYKIGIVKFIVSHAEWKELLASVCRILSGVHAIGNTLKRLRDRDILDDIDFFEIKKFALESEELRSLALRMPVSEINEFSFCDMVPVIEILDPDKTGTATFYLYDSYSPELASRRKELQRLMDETPDDEEAIGIVVADCEALELKVRRELTEKLRDYVEELDINQNFVGYIDLLLAKTRMAVDLNLNAPGFSEDEKISFEGLRFLPLEHKLREENKEFQPVDICLAPGVTMIRGANMGGKSVTLKSLALAQTMMQLGLYVPAAVSSMVMVEDILQSLGDGESHLEGLSSFGAEIMRLSQIRREVDREVNGKKQIFLVLVDEPARTTNPVEGSALVEALVSLLNESGSYCVVTTHYSDINAECRRLRVRGLKEEAEHRERLSVADLSVFMDYSLQIDEDNAAPREALNVASLLGADELLISRAKQYLKK